MANGIHYWCEDLGHGRGQLRRDVVIDGELVEVLCEALGSPAPLPQVEAYVREAQGRGF